MTTVNVRIERLDSGGQRSCRTACGAGRERPALPPPAGPTRSAVPLALLETRLTELGVTPAPRPARPPPPSLACPGLNNARCWIRRSVSRPDDHLSR
jgi:hypothetical protein